MKTKILLTSLSFVCSANLFAQFANDNTASSSGDGWTSVNIQYNSVSLDTEYDEYPDLRGFSIGLTNAWKLPTRSPLFAETGIVVRHASGNSDISTYQYDFKDEYKLNLLTVKIPVNLVYVFDIPNINVTIAPYIGLHINYHLSGKLKETEKEPGHIDRNHSYNIFDEQDFSDYSCDKWNRLQIGWQIGTKVNYSNFYVGLQYGKEFSKIYDYAEIKTNEMAVSLGYKF